MDSLSFWAGLIAQAEPGKFWFATVGACLAAIALVSYGFLRLQRARILEDTPTSHIRSAAQGYVELHGYARMLPGPEIASPLSGQRCCWWDYRVEQRRRKHGSRGGSSWVTIDRGRSDDLFTIEDATGQCIVDPVGATVVPDLSRKWRGSQPRPHSFPRKSQLWGFGEYRYSERMVNYGAAMYALGQFQTQIAFRADDEALELSELLSIWKQDKRELLSRFDANQDGEIDLEEWEVARREAIKSVRAEHVKRSVQPDLNILNKPKGQRPYILSTKTEQELTRAWRWSGLAGLLAGGVLGAGVVFALIARGLL